MDALDILVESGADPGTADVHGAFPLHYAAQMCGSGNDMGNDVRTGLTGATNSQLKTYILGCVNLLPTRGRGITQPRKFF